MFDILNIKKIFPMVGDRIVLRLFAEEDITSSYINWLNDPFVVKFSNQRFKKHTFDSCRNYFQTFANSNDIFISILARDVGCMIGTMTVYINSYHSVADIGIMLGDKNYWGKGIGKEAWESVMNLLLNKTEIRKVTGGALSCNNSMVKIFKGTGMQEDGVRKNQEIVDGKLYDIVHFAKF